jgi:hypothetical protein
MPRDIDDVLKFRQDISPFLIHLCRDNNQVTAESALTDILKQKQLKASSYQISDARFGIRMQDMDKMEQESKMDYFSAVCFTETPLMDIHCLLEIQSREIQLKQYGLVFRKDKLKVKGVSPVLYLSNWINDKEEKIKRDKIVQALSSLINTPYAEVAKEILPLISTYGYKIQAPDASKRSPGIVDFIWEREWRYPHSKGSFRFSRDDIFVGLCPHEMINDFERRSSKNGLNIPFIDPCRNTKWYADKLIRARHDSGLDFSVV